VQQRVHWLPCLDGENVMLSQGRWVRFNEDYIGQLNEYLDDIPRVKFSKRL
jgi:hypothetical protein